MPYRRNMQRFRYKKRVAQQRSKNRTFRKNKHKPINNRIHKFSFMVYKPMESFVAGIGLYGAMQFDLKQALGAELTQF